MSTTRKSFVAGTATAVAALGIAPASAAMTGPGARVVVLYNTPKDPAAFDAYYFEKHAPLAKKLPGLRSYVVSTGPVTTPGAATPPYHLYAELGFDSVDAINAALASPQGSLVVADLPNFASAGVIITVGASKEI